MASYITQSNDPFFEVDIKGIRIASLNVRGLKNLIKQSAIINHLKTFKIDVLGIQDTHLIQNEENNLKQSWRGPCIFAEGSNNSKGLCILFSNNFNLDQITTIYKNDRILICSLKIGIESFIFCNIYAPNDIIKKKLFFNTLTKVIRDNLNENQQKKLFLFGDFNCVMNNSLDIVSGNPHSPDTVKSFNKTIEGLEQIDVWRKHFRNQKNYTWSGGNPLVARRIDYIFASKFLMPFLQSCEIVSIGHTDHRLVFCDLRFYKFKKGKGIYKMNDSLFLDSTFKNTMSNLIKQNIEDLSDIEPILKWNVIKKRVKELSQQFGKYNKIKQKNELEQLRYELNMQENKLIQNPDNLNLQRNIINIKAKLELLNISKTEAAKIRSKVKWIEEGEKNTKYFLNLEKFRANNNTVFELKDREGGLILDEGEIVEEFAKHFESVYDNLDIDTDNIGNNMDNFLQNVSLKTLNPEEKQNIDKPIDITEIEKALKNLNKDSSPGHDGITMSFYLTFFEEIKHTLLEFFNECYSIGNL